MASDMEPLIFPRALNTCTGGKLWYVCTAGQFRGCCSNDPCTTGICLDDDAKNDDDSGTLTDQSDMSITTTQVIAMLPSVTPRTTTTSGATLPQSTTVSTTDPFTFSVTLSGSETIHIPSCSHDFTKTTRATGVSSVLPAGKVTKVTASPSSTPSNTPRAASSNLGAIIGGVLGGVALLVICAVLIFFCCCRHKREYGKRQYGKRKAFAAWYPYKFGRKKRGAASEMTAPWSPSDAEANRSLSTVSQSNNTQSTVFPPEQSLHSSTTDLISYPSSRILLRGPTARDPNELFISVTPRLGFTSELPDTAFCPLHSELATHSQSELINQSLEQRRRQQNVYRVRDSPQGGELSALSPSVNQATRQSASSSRGIDSSSGQLNGGTPEPDPVGQVITAEGVVLAANLDRYSNGREIGESQAQGQRERPTESGDENHVMSFMQYGEGSETRGTERGLGIANSDQPPHTAVHEDSTAEPIPRPAESRFVEEIVAVESEADVPPAYEAQDSSPAHDLKSPSGRMEMSTRNG
ncbi:hypothetical protein N7457_005858 [Penicillium paradoxum]|uniref:uncharacterized protein n=1 Tax=Penicillium paradoxum TaxID=176176 RepID=UPI002546669B|nr:uncharacterized protein N7457_005858 [Penicillium paradoxum]KAJ5780698.1 hypothetical protein N7457_005858 [Penicillium paradoxum]